MVKLNLTFPKAWRLMGGAMLSMMICATMSACSDSDDDTPQPEIVPETTTDDTVSVITDQSAFAGRVQDVEGSEETRAVAANKVLTPIKWIKTPADSLSATSISVYSFTEGGVKKTYGYVSYHTRGASIGGCLEIMDVSDDAISVLQQLRTAYPREFNYTIITSGKRLRAVGSSPKGGQFFNVALNPSTHLFEESLALNQEWQDHQIKLDNGFGDGNWVCVVNDKAYMVASTHGQSMFGIDLPVVTHQNLLRPNSIVKSVDAMNANKVVNGKQLDITAVLRLENSNGEEADAYVDIYETKSAELSAGALLFDLEQPLYSYQVSNAAGPKKVSPIDGKNGIKVFGNGIVLTALGRGGLVKYYRDNTGSGSNQVFDDTFSFTMEYPTETSQLATPGQLIVNDVDMDSNYTYLATSSGLIVLTKQTFEEVAKYQWKDPDTQETGSANFVRVLDNKIYVAYGRSGVIVFKLQ